MRCYIRLKTTAKGTAAVAVVAVFVAAVVVVAVLLLVVMWLITFSVTVLLRAKVYVKRLVSCFVLFVGFKS
jgi:hypothetical protein